MTLTTEQKSYIKKNIRRIPLEQIAADLNLSEKEILNYLKRKWSSEKFGRFERGRHSTSYSENGETASFSFSIFFRENRLVLAFLAILVFVLYANSLGNGFVSDDVGGFLRNPNLGRISSVFSGPAHFSVSAFLQYAAFHIGGLHPFVFRIINIFSHIGVVILIYMILGLSLGKRIAIIAAVLFAVHPIFTESISWISGGLYSLYAFFFLLSFLFYLFAQSNQRYFRWSILFFMLSIFSSEKALVLFLVFILYEMVFGDLKHNWKKIAPFFVISIVILAVYATKIGYRTTAVEAQSYESGGGFYNPLVQIPVAVGSYLKLIFWPAKLTLYQTEMNFTQGQYVALLFVFLAYISATIWSFFKNKTVFFWLVFFVITLLPTLTPLKISWIVAERYVYLGALGVVVVVAMILDKILEFSENSRMVGYFALVLIVGGLSVRTVIRNRDWKNEDTLWMATAAVAPSGQQIHNNLGDVYARQGNYQKAVEEFTLATQINPNYADAYHNLANTYQAMGQNDLALENYQKAASINPQLWQSYQNMAAIYFAQGNFDLAEENIKKALEANPSDQNLQENLKLIEANKK
jgi:protein O-mannosyl-transferase